MLETLISSKTRIKLLLKFFLNANTKGYLRGLSSEFGESSNSIRVELNRLENAGMLKAVTDGNKKYFSANTEHPLYLEIHKILIKYVGIDKILEKIVSKLGAVNDVFLVGDLAQGLDSEIIDLVFIGKVETSYLLSLIEKTEKLISRKVRYIVFETLEASFIDQNNPEAFLLWSKNKSLDV